MTAEGRWFHFRVTGAKGTPLTLRLENAHAASFPEAWHGYKALASHDRRHWFRTATSYEAEGALVIQHTPKVVRSPPGDHPPPCIVAAPKTGRRGRRHPGAVVSRSR